MIEELGDIENARSDNTGRITANLMKDKYSIKANMKILKTYSRKARPSCSRDLSLHKIGKNRRAMRNLICLSSCKTLVSSFLSSV